MVTSYEDNQRPGGGSRSSMDRAGPIVAFDFDGTLTTRDCFMAFLRWRIGPMSYWFGMARLFPAAVSYLFHRDPGRLKAKAVRVFLKGVPRATLEGEALEFASAAAPFLLRPDAVKTWRRYRHNGARLVIVSASPESIVAPFARGLGADLLIGTRLRFDMNDRVEGGFDGRNCRGQEKPKRIREVLGDDVRLAAAYGDTEADRPMLAMADEKYMRLFVGDPGRG